MTTSVQRRRGTTVQHSAFTGLEGEITIDTTKDTAVIHDGTTVGGFPLAKETLENTNTANLVPITGADTAADDTFLIFDASASAMKRITRAELNNAIEKEPLSNVTINSGSIDGTTIGSTTRSTGKFTTLESNSTTTLNGTSIPTSKTLLVTTDIGTSVQAYDADLTTLGAGGSGARTFLGLGTAATTDATAYATAAQGTKADNALTALNPSYTGTLTGGTGVVNLGSGQFYKDASGNVGIGTTSLSGKLSVLAQASTSYGTFDTTTAGFGFITFKEAGTALGYIGPSAIGSGGKMAIASASTNPLVFATNATEAMRIDSSGNVGIGTSSPSSYFAGAEKLVITKAGNTGITIDSGTTGNSNLFFAKGTTGAQQYAGWVQYQNTNDLMIFGVNTAERMRIDSSGNVGIGTSSTATRLHVTGTGNACLTLDTNSTFNTSINWYNAGVNRWTTQVLGDGSNAYRWYDQTYGAERMRIDSSGNLLVGSSSSIAGRLQVTNDANYGTEQSIRSVLGTNNNNTSSYHLVGTTGATDRVYIYGNGNIVNSNNSYGTLSDRKLKTDITSVNSQWNDVKALANAMSKFKLIADDTNTIQLGWIAQDAQKISAGVIFEIKDKDADGKETGEVTLGINTSVAQLKAFKALGEALEAIEKQQVMIEQLTTRLNALEGK